MDIKITFDVTPKLADLAERVCNAIEHGDLFKPAPADYFGCSALDRVFPRAEAPNSPVETPEAKDETPAEPPKPKRSHHKKVEPPKPEPEKPAEPAPAAVEPEPEPEPETDAAPEMTLDEIRSVCVKAAKAGKTKVITDYLAAHDAESLSKLDPKHYAELAKIVKAAL